VRARRRRLANPLGDQLGLGFRARGARARTPPQCEPSRNSAVRNHRSGAAQLHRSVRPRLAGVDNRLAEDHQQAGRSERSHDRAWRAAPGRAASTRGAPRSHCEATNTQARCPELSGTLTPRVSPPTPPRQGDANPKPPAHDRVGTTAPVRPHTELSLPCRWNHPGARGRTPPLLPASLATSRLFARRRHRVRTTKAPRACCCSEGSPAH